MPVPPKLKWRERKLEADCCEVDVAKEEESLRFSLDLTFDAKEGGRRG